MEIAETKREVTERVAEMENVLARVLAQTQVTSDATPRHQQEPVVLEDATTKLPNDIMVKPMTAPTQDVGVGTISLNNATMGMAITSPGDHTPRGGLLESNHGTDDTKDELISPEQLNFMEAISKAMSKLLAP